MTLDIPISKRNSILEGMLVRELRTYFRLNLNGNMRRKWEDYLLTHYDWNSSLLALYELILRSIKFSVINNQYVMYIDPTAMYKKYPVNVIARTLDNGSLDITGDHLITDGFNYLHNNIDILLKKCMGVI